MTTKLTKIVLGLALIAALVPGAGCDERDFINGGHGDEGSWTGVFVDLGCFSGCGGYDVTDEYYVEETYTETTTYYDGGYDGYYPDDGGYYDDWKAKSRD